MSRAEFYWAASIRWKRTKPSSPEFPRRRWRSGRTRWATTSDPLGFFDYGLRALEEHHASGHPIFIITGTLAPLAQVIAARLPVAAGIAATELETCWQGRDAVWTGSIAGEHMSGRAKVKAMERQASQCRLDLARSYAYGDSVRDIPMLERAGHAVAVNPTARMADPPLGRKETRADTRGAKNRQRTGNKPRACSHSGSAMTPFLDSLASTEAGAGARPLARKRISQRMERFGAKFSRWREGIECACGAFEWVTLSYLAILNVLIMVFFCSIPHPQRFIAANQCVALGLLLVACSAHRRPRAL
jgi:HAD superfamily phosphoserine phosphatase-like hydrolase